MEAARSSETSGIDTRLYIVTVLDSGLFFALTKVRLKTSECRCSLTKICL